MIELREGGKDTCRLGYTHKDLTARASVTLGKSPQALAATLATLGRGLGAPWGADQKAAALLAWLLL